MTENNTNSFGFNKVINNEKQNANPYVNKNYVKMIERLNSIKKDNDRNEKLFNDSNIPSNFGSPIKKK